MKWIKGAKEGIVVAGGQYSRKSLAQLNNPHEVIVDDLGNVYVADPYNHQSRKDQKKVELLLVKMDPDKNEISSVVSMIYHSINKVISTSSIVIIIEYKNLKLI
jgi:hypothetical protein